MSATFATVNAHTAHAQWASRPADERFQSLQDMGAVAIAMRQQARFHSGVNPALRVQPENGGLSVFDQSATNGPGPLALTHYSFGQVCTRAGAPAGYLASLPPSLAAACLNDSLPKREQGTFSMLINAGSESGLTLRGITSQRYTRVWNHELIDRVIPLEAHGYHLPLAYANGRFGAGKVPSGAYMGDRDLFIFMVNDDVRLPDPASPEGLGRGFILRNSEVGYASLVLDLFLYQYVCGNHIIWGFRHVASLKRRHVGDNLLEEWNETLGLIHQYVQSSPDDDAALIRRAATRQIAGTKDDVLDELTPILGATTARRAYETAEQAPSATLNPRSPWGIVYGLTSMSQGSPYMDARYTLDKAAQDVLRRFALN